jgi:hypothetical protein
MDSNTLVALLRSVAATIGSALPRQRNLPFCQEETMHAKSAMTSLLVALSISMPAQAVIGMGAHWGFDFSLHSDDLIRQQIQLDSIKINIDPSWGTKPAALGTATTINGKLLPVYIERKGFKRTNANFGGKFYLDNVPIIDAVELSGNFGVWEYDGSIIYPDTIKFRSNTTYTSAAQVPHPDSLFTVVYDTFGVHLANFDGLRLIGVGKTPYVRLNFDLSIKKTVYKPPILDKSIRLFAGGGVSMHMATPLLSDSLIVKSLGDTLQSSRAHPVSYLGDVLSKPTIMESVVNEMMKPFSSPAWGMHLTAGATLKFPGNLLGLYLDGKYMIPFSKLSGAVNASGFVFNLGMSAGF